MKSRRIEWRRSESVLGRIVPGLEVCGISRGDLSFIEVIAHCVEVAGEECPEPLAVRVGSWTCAEPDVLWLADAIDEGRIGEFTLVLDNSIGLRRTSDVVVRAMLERLPGKVWTCPMHGKFATVRGGGWDLAVRSSANLNHNRRMELFEVSDDGAVCDEVDRVVGLIAGLGWGLDRVLDRYANEREFFAAGGKPLARNAAVSFGVKAKGLGYGIK